MTRTINRLAIIAASIILLLSTGCDRNSRPDNEAASPVASGVAAEGETEGQVMAATGAVVIPGVKDIKGDPTSRPMPPVDATIELSPERWQDVLTDVQFEILREEGTERAFTGPLLDVKEPGTFHCAGCNAPLFKTETKFESGTGWPSFYAPIDDRVGTKPDNRYGMVRTEVHCDACGGHLGHIFEDGPEPTGLRYCINSVSMNFRPDSLPEPPSGIAPELKPTE